MKKIFLAFFLIGIVNLGFSQITPTRDKSKSQSQDGLIQNDNYQEDSYQGSTKSTSNKNLKNKDAKIEQYLIISQERDTTYVDTTLRVKRDYKFNYLRKDNFNLISFSNVGQSYNTLIYNLEDSNLMPSFGARARHFNYMEIEDINYYHVPTPFTELYYKTAFSQGQQIDAFFTVNTSKQFNFSIAYKGMRSLGKYQHALTSTGNFRFTSSYKTKNNRYIANGHIVMQDLMNEENGGIQDSNVPYFESGNPEFKDRSVLAVNFNDAENILKGKRFFLDHRYKLLQEKDSLAKNKLSIGNIISFEDKYYEYNQEDQNDYFGEAFQQEDLRDRVTLEDFYTQLYAEYSNSILGKIKFQIAYNNFNYGYDKVTFIDNTLITNRLLGDVYSVGGTYSKKIKKFSLEGNFGLNISGDFEGNYITGKAAYQFTDDIEFSAKINHNSKAPNYNYLLYQSVYQSYNWQTNFNNVKTQNVEFALNSNKIANVSVDITSINDYTYFKKVTDTGSIKPFQSDKSISYLTVKLEKEIKYKKFALDNSIVYQTVKDDNNVFNVPEIVTRNTLYYSNYFFKKALFLQTGVTFNYFSKYYMNGYDPLLAEFYVQTDREYGGFPRFDFFVNAKIQQARIYIKAEHFNSAWTGYDYYSAPNHPYRDFTIRFGIVWNFFL
ncbi:putative porin [Xanthomarina sp. F2636L]|uniref:putative porin n=1 Tax=Xanthomarina sp. F2636L TaxID=2996018 RepID=UPI00225DFBDE|nr:putative porin [Xanthomarina sp. F2636L]MCX7550654.1 putative porin [Xanthomarina sp. F2636L]